VFRIFIDESGHSDLKSSSHPNEQYLGLTGVIMPLAYEMGEFTENLNALKNDVFGTDSIVLDRKELLVGKAPFECLLDENKRAQFDALFLDLLSDSKYRVFSVVIDKKEHLQKYAVWQFDPYHYCLMVALERYVRLLDQLNQTGDVMVESRGEKENRRLQRAYRYVYDNGSDYIKNKVFQTRLSSREVKLQPKSANVSGLQLSDALANPCCRALICEKTNVGMKADFGKKIVEVLMKKKFLKSPAGRVNGWGTKLLP
jgi:hypothetical protein